MPDPIEDIQLQERIDGVASEVSKVWQDALAETQVLISESKRSIDAGLEITDIAEIEEELRQIMSEAALDMEGILNRAIADEIIDSTEDVAGMLHLSVNDFPEFNTHLLSEIFSQVGTSVDGAEQKAFQVASTLTEELRRIQLEALALGELERRSHRLDRQQDVREQDGSIHA